MTCCEHTDTAKTPREVKTYFTYCPLCNGLADELVLGLVVKYLDTDGKLLAYGHPGGEVAKYLKTIEKEYDYEVVAEGERLPAIDLCYECKVLLDAQTVRFHKIVADGGVQWFCEICKKAGVIVADDSQGFAKRIRQETKIFAPDTLTVKFNDCRQHASVEDVYTAVQ